MSEDHIAPYLAPYYRASFLYGGDFETLCWTSLNEQIVRFEAMIRVYNFAGKSIIDAGCGRADFLNFLTEADITPISYIGIEAIRPLADRARSKLFSGLTSIQTDFVASGFPRDVSPDVVTFSGSLNTLKTNSLKRTLLSALYTARHAVVFNFLSSPAAAGAPWLAWHAKDEVFSLFEGVSCELSFADGYLDGDMTVVVKHTSPSPK